MNIFKSRKFRQGSMATLITVLVIVLVVVVNMVATALSERFSLSLDLTTNKVFSLSNETKDFLKTLDKDVTVYILSDEETFMAGGVYYTQAGEVIKRYAQHNPRIKVVYKDIIKDPTFVANYPNLSLTARSILIECEDKNAVLTAYDLFNIEVDYNAGTAQAVSSKAEQAMSSALLNVTSDKKITLTVLEGHNEYDISYFTDVLRMNNYEITTQNLMTDEINPDATIAVMAAPMRDISEAEAKKLDAFLSNGEKYGKTFFYLASVDQTVDTPVIDALLAEWGIGINPGVVFDINMSNIFSPGYYYTIAGYAEDEYSANVQTRKLPAGLPYSRPLEILYENKSFTTTKELLTFSSTAGVRASDAATDWVPSQSDISGPITGMAISQMTKYDNATPMTSNIVVCGSVDLIADYMLGSPNMANSDYVLDLLNSISGREDVIHIQDKTLGGTELGLTDYSQVITISIVLTIIFPLAVLVLGIVIWMRRRHR
ncbi:MAG: Gldg family protein [Oscillospiraceae bacterium]|jgi:ABC-type uncharacterized transport system involved in gliding motility auxiliary subunit|nr:Gldg family protein [Oscillospiraceae bacterium]